MATIKICATSDLHGSLPVIPPCDLLLLAGDYAPTPALELFWLRETFAPWLHTQSGSKKVIGVAGNHDFAFERHKAQLPQLGWTYLQDSWVTWHGLKIYGSPWQKRFFDWAFNADEHQLERYWAQIPDDADIIVLHGPPHGYGDYVERTREQVGSPSLTARIEAIKPKLVVYGHIHPGYGRYQIGDTILLNCAHCNEKYKPVNQPWLIDLEVPD
jgi:Icc-related predicted phosphoesterase